MCCVNLIEVKQIKAINVVTKFYLLMKIIVNAIWFGSIFEICSLPDENGFDFLYLPLSSWNSKRSYYSISTVSEFFVNISCCYYCSAFWHEWFIFFCWSEKKLFGSIWKVLAQNNQIIKHSSIRFRMCKHFKRKYHCFCFSFKIYLIFLHRNHNSNIACIIPTFKWRMPTRLNAGQLALWRNCILVHLKKYVFLKNQLLIRM